MDATAQPAASNAANNVPPRYDGMPTVGILEFRLDPSMYQSQKIAPRKTDKHFARPRETDS